MFANSFIVDPYYNMPESSVPPFPSPEPSLYSLELVFQQKCQLTEQECFDNPAHKKKTKCPILLESPTGIDGRAKELEHRMDNILRKQREALAKMFIKEIQNEPSFVLPPFCMEDDPEEHQLIMMTSHINF